MNKEIAEILRDRIKDLPFIDVCAGLVQTIVVANDPNNEKRRFSFPMSYDVDTSAGQGSSCYVGKERDLMPDSSKKSIFYFEDMGISPAKVFGRPGFQSTIRLVGWINRSRLLGDKYINVSTFAMSAIVGRLARKNPINIGNMKMLSVTVGTIPRQDASLFSRYSYDESVTQFLMPPFECIGIDFICKYIVKDNCLINLNFEGGSVCY